MTPRPIYLCSHPCRVGTCLSPALLHPVTPHPPCGDDPANSPLFHHALIGGEEGGGEHYAILNIIVYNTI